MKKVIILLSCFLVLVLSVSCGKEMQQEGQNDAPTEDEHTVTQAPEEGKEDGSPEADEVLQPEKIQLDGQTVSWDQFPMPTAETFALTGETATIYHAMAAVYNPQTYAETLSQSPYENTDLSLPAFDVYEKASNEDGSTTYYGIFYQCDYYNAGSGLTDLADPTYELHKSKSPAAITIDPEGNLAEFTQTYESSDDPEADIRRVCGPMTDLADFFCGKIDSYPTSPQSIPGLSAEDMLIVYLNYFFTA